MSEDIFQFCITGKIRNGYLSKDDYEAICIDGAHNDDFKFPTSVDEEDGNIVFFENPESLDCFLLETDTQGNTGFIYNFQHAAPYRCNDKPVSANRTIQLFQALIEMGVDELDIKVQAITYYSGSDCPLEF